MRINYSITLTKTTSDNLQNYAKDMDLKLSGAVEKILQIFFDTKASEIERNIEKLEREEKKLDIQLNSVRESIANIKKEKKEAQELEVKEKEDYLNSLDKWDRAKIEARERRIKQKAEKEKENADIPPV